MIAEPPTTTRLLADVRALWSRERALILAVAPPFLFLPPFALQLLTPPGPALPAERTQATMATWFDALTVWAQANAGWYLLADTVAILGVATLAVLLIDPARPAVAAALSRGVRLWPRFLLASVLAAVPIGLGLWMLILPGLLIQARLIVAAPALAADQPLSAAGALSRSWRMTARATPALFGATAVLFLLQWLALRPLASFEEWLRLPGHLNPFVLALVDAAMAAVTTLYGVAVLLLGVVGYRRLAN